MISKRSAIVFSYDLLTIPLAWLLAYSVRFNFTEVPAYMVTQAFHFLPLVVFVQTFVFWLFGLYRGHWRFASIPDVVRILQAVSLGALCILLVLFLYPQSLGQGQAFPPRSIFLLYVLILIALLAGARLTFRYLKDFAFKSYDQQRILIVGAGSAGEALARDLLRDPEHRYHLIGFVDDSPNKKGAEIHGIRVLGKTTQIEQIVKSEQINLVLIAVPSAAASLMRLLVERCTTAQVAYRTLPGLSALASGDVSIRDLREVSLEDLLGRDPINLQDPTLNSFFANKKIMVTGGGGSIGSELCRQLAEFNPAVLIVLDHSEFNLYQIEKELTQTHPRLTLDLYLQDVTQKERVCFLMSQCKPDLVFHAAAYKHVPLLESQICVAVNNNVLGTQVLAEAAVQAGVAKFILVSTDKAVNPSNVMGATKRVAEVFCQNYNMVQTTTQFITVRFGNVLGSAGSVVPLFKKQIAEGGPVTVTHPDMTRYFMTIPEASQLILHSSVMGEGGAIYVLDMGEPIKIMYLAEQLIKLSGKRVGEDIAITITGLRPGEKLYEELFHSAEALEATTQKKLLKAKSRMSDWAVLLQLIEEMQLAVLKNDSHTLFNLLKKAVPEGKLIHV